MFRVCRIYRFLRQAGFGGCGALTVFRVCRVFKAGKVFGGLGLSGYRVCGF